MPAGEVTFSDSSARGHSDVPKTPERTDKAGQSELLAHLFSTGSREYLNERAAFESLVNDSDVSWEALGSRGLPDGAMTHQLRTLAREYLAIWRITSRDKTNRAQALQENMRQLVATYLQ